MAAGEAAPGSPAAAASTAVVADMSLCPACSGCCARLRECMLDSSCRAAEAVGLCAGATAASPPAREGCAAATCAMAFFSPFCAIW